MADAAPFVAGFYLDQERFVSACAAARKAGHQPIAFTPWPVHGLEHVLGIKRSLIGRPVLAIILIGFAIGMHMEWFTMSQNWPLNVGGKPYFAWPTFLVVALETGLLFGALTNFALAFHTCKLMPDPDTRLLNDRMTDDTFTLVLPVRAGETAESLSAWLRANRCDDVDVRGAAGPAGVAAAPPVPTSTTSTGEPGTDAHRHEEVTHG